MHVTRQNVYGSIEGSFPRSDVSMLTVYMKMSLKTILKLVTLDNITCIKDDINSYFFPDVYRNISDCYNYKN